MCPGNGDYPMCPGNETSQSALGMGPSNVTLGMGLANVPWEWDYPMCPENKTIQCTLGMGLANVPGILSFPGHIGVVPCAQGSLESPIPRAHLPLEWDYQMMPWKWD